MFKCLFATSGFTLTIESYLVTYFQEKCPVIWSLLTFQFSASTSYNTLHCMPKPKVRNFIAQCTLIDSCLYSGSTTAQLQVLQFAVLPVTKLILQDRGHSSFDFISYSPLKEEQNVGGPSCSVLILSSHYIANTSHESAPAFQKPQRYDCDHPTASSELVQFLSCVMQSPRLGGVWC